jgi:hypothetical protein
MKAPVQADPSIDFSLGLRSAVDRAGDLRAAFNRYSRVGRALRDLSVEVDGGGATIQSFVKELLEETALPRPFGVVDGPSGIGKTQQFFALRDVKVVYIPVTNWGSSPEANQDIYRVFQGVSEAFTSALTEDLSYDFRSVKDGLSSGAFFSADSIGKLRSRNWRLLTPGVVLALLRRLNDVDDDNVLETLAGVKSTEPFEYSAATIGDLSAYVSALKKKKKDNFIFVLDEVPGYVGGEPSGDNLQKFTFCRSLLRACGLTVIFAGTGSTVLNHMSGPSSTDAPRLFCKVVTEVAKPTMVTLGAALDVQELEKVIESLNVLGLGKLIVTARPRLAYWLAREAISLSNGGTSALALDDLLDCVAAHLFEHKRSLRESDGQWASFQQQGQYVEGIEQFIRARVVSHMANLYITCREQPPDPPLRAADFFATSDGTQLRVRRGVDAVDYVPAVFQSYFPTTTEEPLLYMLLHGGRTPQSRAFGRHYRVSVITERRCIDSRPVVDDGGSSPQRSGSKLEALVCVAMCVASRSSGLAGTVAGTFLTLVCSELSLHTTETAWTKLECAEGLSWHDVLGDLSDHVHPYLFHPAPVRKGEAPSWSVPNFVCAADRRIGQIYRCLDSEEHDVNVILPPDGVDCAPNVFRVTAECKNRDKKLQTTYLVNNCIKKIPSDSHVHLVVCDAIGPHLFKGDAGRHVMFDVNKVVPGGAAGVTEKKRIRVLKVTRFNTRLKVEYVSASHKAAWDEEHNKADHIVLVLSIFSLAAKECQSDVSSFLSS